MAACAIVAMTACDQPAAPSSVPSLSGEWAGTIRHSLAGEGTLSLVVSQRGPGIFGQWAAAYADASAGQSGTFSATITGTPFTLFLRPSVPTACGGNQTLNGTLAVVASVANDRMTGPFTILDCSGVISGSIELSRR
jgi:hypothetical protein